MMMTMMTMVMIMMMMMISGWCAEGIIIIIRVVCGWRGKRSATPVEKTLQGDFNKRGFVFCQTNRNIIHQRPTEISSGAA